MRNRLTERDLSRIVKRVINESNESEKRKLVFESIMQTINERGLHGAVGRSLLTEGDAPEKGFVFKDIDDLGRSGARKTKGEGSSYGETHISPYQSTTSLAEAQQIIQKLILIMSKGGAQVVGKQLASVLGQITANNYFMILWKVRYGSAFKSITKRNYNTIKDWIGSKGMDRPTSGAGPVPGIYNLFQDPTVFNALRRLGNFNYAEYPKEENNPLSIGGYDSRNND
jgi:hypothetical protein